MCWIYLFIASLFEIGWPIGLKYADISSHRLLWIVFALVAMILSGYFLFLAQKTIPIGTAYAVWTGIGVVGTFLLSILLFHDTANLTRAIGVLLILSGVLMLKLSH